MSDIWKTIEIRLSEIYSLSHNLPDHASPIHGVVVGELLALAYEETVLLVTHPQLKRSRIGRH